MLHQTVPLDPRLLALPQRTLHLGKLRLLALPRRSDLGRAGKHVNKKLEKKSYYEAQDLYRNYWGVRDTRRVPFEEASDEYFEELLDHYNWHFSLGRYKPEAEEEVPVEVEVEVEDPVDAGSAASASAEIVTGREFLGEQPVVLTPRQPDYPPSTSVEATTGTSSSRRPASPPVHQLQGLVQKNLLLLSGGRGRRGDLLVRPVGEQLRKSIVEGHHHHRHREDHVRWHWKKGLDRDDLRGQWWRTCQGFQHRSNRRLPVDQVRQNPA